MSQELVKLLPKEPIASLVDLRQTWDKLKGHCNLVTPVAQVDSILPMHRVSLRSVVIDPRVNTKGMGPEVYKAEFCEANERALGKVGIEKICAAAGVQIVGRLRLDDRSQAYYCEIEVTMAVRDFDGHPRVVTKGKSIDLRDGSALASKFDRSPAMLRHQREHILSLCESKAGLRAARSILILKQKYTVEELALPFVIPKLVVALDPADPDQKAALITMAVQGDRMLYGPAPSDPMARLLKDVTPPPPALTAGPGNPPPPLAAAADDPDPDEEPAEEEFELLDTSEEEALILCGCVCGHQREITAATAESTLELVGKPLCRECFPGLGFDVKMHEDLPKGGNLQLPKKPGLTVEKVEAGLRKAKAK